MGEEKMTPEELAYESGRRRTLINLLDHVRDELFKFGKVSPEVRVLQLEAERLEAISRLREVCGEYGDNDWPETLHLADIIEKHLGRHLDDLDRGLDE